LAYVVIARWTARPGEEEAVAAAIDALIEPSRAEPGMIVYQPHRDPSDPRIFVLYEQYIDEAAYAAHGDSPHFKRFALDDAIPRLQARERTFLQTW
jgi:autoinducer 2-degrading protein